MLIDRQIGTQRDRQASKQIKTQTDRHASRRTNRQTDKWRHKDIKAGRQVCKHPERTNNFTHRSRTFVGRQFSATKWQSSFPKNNNCGVSRVTARKVSRNICKNGEDRQEKRKAGIHRERERENNTDRKKMGERESERVKEKQRQRGRQTVSEVWRVKLDRRGRGLAEMKILTWKSYQKEINKVYYSTYVDKFLRICIL